MSYSELVFTISFSESHYRDLVINSLAGIGYDIFEETDSGFKTYILSAKLDPIPLEEILESYSPYGSIEYQINTVSPVNWNEEWEKNFDPLIIGDTVYVRASFHTPRPEYPFEIVIDPKMSFGTGHHQTTSLMIECMLKEEFSGKSVLDMGCGTAILGILASKKGAASVLAIDNDRICIENADENLKRNKVVNAQVKEGSKEMLTGKNFDIILANINRNILLDQMESYSKILAKGGFLLISGFYEEPDLEILNQRADEMLLKLADHKTRDKWIAAKFVK